MKKISIAKLESIETVNQLIEQFNEYDKIFKLVYFRYNGKNEDITLQYRLRTYKNFMNREEFVENLLIQYLKNPIQIPSDLFYVEIYDQETTENLGLNPKYFGVIDNFFIFNLTNLFNLESGYIDIIIYSKFNLDINSIIAFNISKQPRISDKKFEKYELTALLKTNIMPPERFQCIDIKLTMNLVLNDFLAYHIPKRFMIAANRWYNMEATRRGNIRKKKFYYSLIQSKYKITPLQFNDKIHSLLMDISMYICENYDKILTIDNKRGRFLIKLPKGLKIIERRSIAISQLKFVTGFDNNNYISNAILTLDFSWMKELFDKHFR